MKIGGLFSGSLIAVALNLLVTFSGVSQGYVSFDSADSNPGAGIYSFFLSGVSLDMAGSPYQLSDFTLSGFSAAGNTQALEPIGPSDWGFIGSDIDTIQYQPSVVISDLNLNGPLEISTTPNLSGSITWSFDFFIVPGSPVPPTISGDVSISSVPEPSSVTLIGITVMLLVIRRLYMSMWPNTARGCVKTPAQGE
jgi:hypothetical protein